MSSDFYLKAQTLHEEFKKKELHYLNAERKLNNSLMWKKDLNVPLQEYLQKIQQKEKKNEESYQNIMKQMNELDQHTDLLCLKIDKLGIFRNIQVGHNLNDINYNLASRYIPENLHTVQNTNTKPAILHFESDNSKPSASTQTEGNVYCDNCKSLIEVSFQPSQLENSASSIIDILSVSKDEPQIVPSARFQDDNDSQLLTSALNAEHFPLQKNQDNKYVKNNSKRELQTNKNYEAKCTDASAVLEGKQFSFNSNDVLVTENTPKSSGNKEISTKSQTKSNVSEINVEVSMHKNDADSVNHEFDFLESDTVNSLSKIESQNTLKNNTDPASDFHKRIGQTANLEVKHPSKSAVKLKKESGSGQLIIEQDISDNKSETSVSVSGTRSPVISVSDSDSINEKGSFTADTAYQSLLGKTVVPAKLNKYESESEDEVEKTLARTIQKSNVKPKPSVQPKKDKIVPQSVDSKPVVKQKSVSSNKPQSKLSKSTRKVLGLDSSSSSEIEAAIKPPENKKEEDSDEFDFYD